MWRYWSKRTTLFSKSCLFTGIVRCNFKEMGLAIVANLVSGHLYSGNVRYTKLGKNCDRFQPAETESLNCKRAVRLPSYSFLRKNLTYFLAAECKRI